MTTMTRVMGNKTQSRIWGSRYRETLFGESNLAESQQNMLRTYDMTAVEGE